MRVTAVLLSFLLLLVTLFFSMTLCSSSSSSSDNEIHYNIPDPECSGPFGLCTQEDKDRLGYLAIKKLHEIMDDDRDGNVEIQETQEFMAEELQLKNGAAQEKEKKFHESDADISVEEMWKTWQYSEVYNWTTDQVCAWIGEQVKLPQYAEYFRRNRIDGQFLPRLAVNDHSYYAIVMQIKEPKHRRLIMIKSTDLVLFGQSHKPYSLVKDVLMVGSLTVSILVCIYLYSKHRQSLEQIKQMINEFEKLTEMDLNTSRQLINHNPNLSHVLDDSPGSSSSPGGMVKRRSTNDLLGFNFLVRSQQKENKLMSEKNNKLSMELGVAKREAEQLKRERESADGQLRQLELAIKELDKVRGALRQAEARLEMNRFQAPPHLLSMLNRAFDSEKELFDYKQKTIEKEKNMCYNELNKLSKRQSGVFGAFKLVHSSYIEELNHRIDLIKHDSEKLKAQRAESLRRWNSIWTSIDEASSGGKVESKLAIDYSSSNLLHETVSSNSLVDHQRPNAATAAQVKAESVVTLPKSQTCDVLNSTSSSNAFKTTSQSKQATLNLFNSSHSIHKDSSKFDLNLVVSNEELMAKMLPGESLATLDENQPVIISSASKFNLPETSEPQTTTTAVAAGITNSSQLQAMQFMIANNNNNIKNGTAPLPTVLTTTTIITPTSLNGGGQKIARDSIIHKADVFQFDDVDSIHTHDSLYVPRSDEDDQPGIDEIITYSSSEQDHATAAKKTDKKSSSKKNKKNKDGSHKKSNMLTNLITPLMRNNSNKTNNNLTVKSPTTTTKENSLSVKFQEEAKLVVEKQEVVSIEKSKSISKHLNSLKRLLINSSGSSPSNSTTADIVNNKNSKKLTESASVNLIRSMSDVISPGGGASDVPTITAAVEPATNEAQDDIKALKKSKFPTIKLNRRKSASKLQSTTATNKQT